MSDNLFYLWKGRAKVGILYNPIIWSLYLKKYLNNLFYLWKGRAKMRAV